MASLPGFRVVIFSSIDPAAIARLAERIQKEVPEARVCGILYEEWTPKPLSRRALSFLKNLRDPAFIRYAAARVIRGLSRPTARFGHLLLRLAHAHQGRSNALHRSGVEALTEFCRRNDCSIHLTRDIHAPESLAFVRGLGPDLGIVYGTRILKADLFTIPRQGSINIHKRKLPDYRGGGPIGLWELLEGAPDIGVTVHRVQSKVDAGAILGATTIPIEPFDTLSSLDLKAQVVGGDLLVETVAGIARGDICERPQEGPSRLFRSPAPQTLAAYERQIRRARPPYQPERGRPAWKLLTKTLLFGLPAIWRNWSHRRRGGFPVVVLYHHLVSDRPHPMGIPTDLYVRHVRFLQEHYQIVTLAHACDLLKQGRVKVPTVVLTFDDGYQDNFLTLRAIREETGAPMMLFVCTEKVTNHEPFEHDTRVGQGGFLALTWEQIRLLEREGFEIGSHTRTHFDCGSSDPAVLRNEIVGSQEDLRRYIGRAVESFSFPWGQPANMSAEAVELARSTFPYVCSAYGGVNLPGQNPSWHILRCSHPNDLWELELVLQSLLEFTPARAGPAAIPRG
jgi:peptidoglycan/xylan/chitin deacetylase (PgdA/CDA1 family)